MRKWNRVPPIKRKKLSATTSNLKANKTGRCMDASVMKVKNIMQIK